MTRSASRISLEDLSIKTSRVVGGRRVTKDKEEEDIEVAESASGRSRAHDSLVGQSVRKRPRRDVSVEEGEVGTRAAASDSESVSEIEDREMRDAEVMECELLRTGKQPMGERIKGNLLSILEIAQGSKNLKGIQKLRDAVDQIQVDVRAMSNSPVEEKLLAENKRLSKEIEDLRGQMLSLHNQTAPAAFDLGELQRSIMLSVGTMVDAKLAGITERLPPEQILRPPLAADRRLYARAVQATGSGPKPFTKPSAKPVLKQLPTSAKKPPVGTASKPNSGPSPTLKPISKEAQKSSSKPATNLVSNPAAPSLEKSSGDEGWTQVSRRKKNGRKTSLGPTKPTAKAQSGKARRKRRQRERRAALTPAVVLTIEPKAVQDGLTYKKVLELAKENINVAEMGIDMAVNPIKVKRTQTGARILELPRNIGQEGADLMAERLRVIYNDGTVRVHRPIKCAELRVSDLDDSVTKEDLLAAVELKGQCPPGTVKVGDLRLGSSGMYTALVKLPLLAAPRLITTRTEKFLVGWSSARVVQLQTRPMKCFRCLEIGHTRALCTNEIDRSNLCYRCAQPDHKAANCTAPAKCAICEPRGRKADHQMGSRECALPVPNGPRRVPARVVAARMEVSHRAGGEMMEL